MTAPRRTGCVSFSSARRDTVRSARSRQREEEIRLTGSSQILLTKDGQAKLHACLIPWEELDELSARENELTGRNIDYKQMDVNNVLTLPKLLQAEEKRKAEEEKERQKK